MTETNIPFLRCVDCRIEIPEAETKGLSCCPNCRSNSIPMHSDDDIEIKINWHELRILVMWAERWAIQADENAKKEGRPLDYNFSAVKSVYSIAETIVEQYQTLNEKSPLTLAEDIGKLREKFPDAKTTFPGIEGMSVENLDDDS